MRNLDAGFAQHPFSDPLENLAYAGGKPAVQAFIKAQYSDFIVEEELGFELSGEGEHLWLRLSKQGLGTVEVARLLSEVSGVALRDIGYSGMKDRRGDTSQWFSLRSAIGVDELGQGLSSASVRLLESQRNGRKLKIGSHKRNHFKLLLRDCQGEVASFEARLRHIHQRGFPNYFGLQRFGREFSNLKQLQQLLLDPSQFMGQKPGGRKRLGMLISAARSMLFNELLSRRVAQGDWDSYVPGDILALAGSKGLFALKSEELWTDELQRRLESFDIHPTGPLPGLGSAAQGLSGAKQPGRYEPRDEAADIEKTVLANFAAELDWLKAQRVTAGRRPLRVSVPQLSWSWPQPGQLLLEFALPPGAYATSLLRELCDFREP